MAAIQRREKINQPQLCSDDLYDILLTCMRIDRSARVHPTLVTQMIDLYLFQFGTSLARNTEWPSVDDLRLAREKEHTETPEDDLHFDIDLVSDDFNKRFASMQVSVDSIVLGEELGDGGFGPVVLGKFTNATGETFDTAVKMLKASDPDTENKFLLEAKLLKAIKHTNIVRVHAVHTVDKPFMIVSELLSRSTLQSYLRKSRTWPKRISTVDLVDITLQMANAMTYLSSIHVVHRDVAAR